MKKILLIILLLIIFIIGIRIGPSPQDPYDEPGCNYLSCQDKCISDFQYESLIKAEFSKPGVVTPPSASLVCPRIGCGPNTDLYHCAAKDNKCVKQLKPMCIIIFGNYFCSNFKFYSRESCM